MAPKTEQPDHSSLQPWTPHDAPEVVPVFEHRGSPQRNSSMHSPEPYDTKQQYEYYGGQQADQYHGQPPRYEPGGEKQPDGINQRRVCGMRRKVFFWILALAIAIIVLAAVLGGVLGSVLGGSDSNS